MEEASSSWDSEKNTVGTVSSRCDSQPASATSLIDRASIEGLQGTNNDARLQPSEDIAYAVRVTIEDVKDVSSTLTAINFKEVASIYFTKDGMRAAVDDAKCFEGSAIIPAEVFREYKLAEDFIAFQVFYRAFVNCINIYGRTGPDSCATCQMFYAGKGCPLKILIECEGAVTECTLQTMDNVKPILDFPASPTSYITKVIMKSKFLKSAWHDLDLTRDDLVLLISNKEPYIRLQSESHLAKTTITIPKDSEAIEYFMCLEAKETRYHMSFLRPSIKAFNISSRISIRTTDQGVLFLQFLVMTPNGHSCFVDFMCHPNVEDDEANSSTAHTFSWRST